MTVSAFPTTYTPTMEFAAKVRRFHPNHRSAAVDRAELLELARGLERRTVMSLIATRLAFEVGAMRAADFCDAFERELDQLQEQTP